MYWQNHAQLVSWEDAITARRVPVQRGLVLDRDDRARRSLIGRLMCDGFVDLAELGKEHDLDAEHYFARELASLETVGELASYDHATKTVVTTPIGRLLVRNVCMIFDRYQRETPDEARFSSTI